MKCRVSTIITDDNKMKAKLIILITLISALHVNAINVTIIESQTGNAWAIQDSIWRNVASGMGYNASVVPQSTLDAFSNLSATDVLIVSSATISFASTNHLQTIRQFVLSGRSAYIQSEYQGSFQGNITFDSLMQTVNANFNWTSTVSGSLVPMNVLGTLSTTPNNLATLNYFNYGRAGTGTGVEKFLEYNGDYFGFCYSDSISTNGTVITTSDEDWAWNNASPELMENILHRLVNAINTANIKYVKMNSSFNIFPNPFTSETTIKTNELYKNASFEIYNLYGQQVKQINNLSEKTITLHRDNLPSGIYFMYLTQDNKIITTNKLVITD